MRRPLSRPLVRPAALAAAGSLLVLSACADGGDSSSDPSSTGTAVTPSATEPTTGTASPTATPPRTPQTDGDVTTGLDAPWDVAFMPDGAAIVPERDSGLVRIVYPDGLTIDAGEFPEADGEDEAGLLGVAVSPDFGSDRALYFYLTTAEDNRVVRRVLTEDGTLGEQSDVLTGIPSSNRHDGGRVVFGPDGLLYVSTGDAGEASLAQDPDSLAGKILRITPDGQPAPDNPDPGSPVYSLGHRNVQGLAFDPEGRLWASEFGNQAFDELNLIEAGGNYGWPEVEGAGGEGSGFVDPVATWAPSEASPSGLAYAEGSLWMASLRGQRLWRIDLDPAAGAVSGEPTAFLTEEYGRLRQVTPAPDGTLWLLTNNTDGRVEPRDGDDRIVRLTLG
ncbi:PQQ-dependent sugar dehydrogenase [Nocardioides zeae]|uniref:PQQ-dependent sugar dehydrogenase n=1 Tax=Nocardioides imazamoxiresistens TaxID=3231893 RepID=A0ABU3PRE4_9ACTN|nr:PQQ-dependent sugar dehydrogenase [Nocardioides zeae]MDT9591798.1 PQQ-dependent sugar dehydrogenase [Nocardioides zeae]